MMCPKCGKTLYNKPIVEHLEPGYKRCTKCLEIKPTTDFYKKYSNCKACVIAYQREWIKKSPHAHARKVEISRMQRADKNTYFYEDWLSLLSILKTKPMLTEEQWVQACRYFKGCAICGEPHIEVRDILVRASEGGVYSVVNVVPLCGNCVSMSKRKPNPFLWITRDYPDEVVERICAYLVEKIKEVYDATEKNGTDNDGVC